MKNLPSEKFECFEASLTFENIYEAWQTVRRTCKNKRNLFEFGLNEHANLYAILRELRSGTYRPDPYYPFMIFEPKPRLVMSQSVRDKIVNHFFANKILMPALEDQLVVENCATRKGMGTSYAISLVKRYFGQLSQREPNKEIYALKLDISKYFYTIDHAVLMEKVKRHLSDARALDLLGRLISETNKKYVNVAIDKHNRRCSTDIPHYKNGKGLSIGAMSSQFLAIFYLSELDHFIKEELQCEYFVRYMDDFLILSTDKERLRKIWRLLEQILKEEYLLKLNPKTEIFPCRRGFNFLGYRFRVINNRLQVGMARKTRLRVRRRLAERRREGYLQYRHALSSYYGYWLSVQSRCTAKRRPDFRISTLQLLAHYPNQQNEVNLVCSRAFLCPHGDVFGAFLADLLLDDLTLGWGERLNSVSADRIVRLC